MKKPIIYTSLVVASISVVTPILEASAQVAQTTNTKSKDSKTIKKLQKALDKVKLESFAHYNELKKTADSANTDDNYGITKAQASLDAANEYMKAMEAYYTNGKLSGLSDSDKSLLIEMYKPTTYQATYSAVKETAKTKHDVAVNGAKSAYTTAVQSQDPQAKYDKTIKEVESAYKKVKSDENSKQSDVKAAKKTLAEAKKTAKAQLAKDKKALVATNKQNVKDATKAVKDAKANLKTAGSKKLADAKANLAKVQADGNSTQKQIKDAKAQVKKLSSSKTKVDKTTAEYKAADKVLKQSQAWLKSAKSAQKNKTLDTYLLKLAKTNSIDLADKTYKTELATAKKAYDAGVAQDKKNNAQAVTDTKKALKDSQANYKKVKADENSTQDQLKSAKADVATKQTAYDNAQILANGEKYDASIKALNKLFKSDKLVSFTTDSAQKDFLNAQLSINKAQANLDVANAKKAEADRIAAEQAAIEASQAKAAKSETTDGGSTSYTYAGSDRQAVTQNAQIPTQSSGQTVSTSDPRQSLYDLFVSQGRIEEAAILRKQMQGHKYRVAFQWQNPHGPNNMYVDQRQVAVFDDGEIMSDGSGGWHEVFRGTREGQSGLEYNWDGWR
ncbi:MAG: hypothetical protein LBM27_02005 [Lactobacillaceae bacterium]|jgi:hypothetical protein|nr:hypothetical protein [Lactobacillaceae bacterium]